MVKQPAEGSAAEEATESAPFEKKEDAKTKFTSKKGKRITPAAAKRLAAMLKGKKKVVVAPKSAPVVDAEDLVDHGVDEDKE